MLKSFSKNHACFFLMLFILGACSSTKNLRIKQAGIHYDAGTQNLVEGNYTDALVSLLKANELDPDNSEILNNLAMAYYFKGETDLAMKNLNRSLEVKPNNTDAKVNLASIHYKNGNVQAAEKIYKEVLKDLTYGKQARTYFNLALIELKNKNNVRSAQAYLEKSLKENDSYCPAHYQLGLIKLKEGRFKDAHMRFRESTMGTCFEYPASHYYMGVALAKMGKASAARAKFIEVESRFKNSNFAAKAKEKVLELNDLDIKEYKQTQHAFKDSAKSPEF